MRKGTGPLAEIHAKYLAKRRAVERRRDAALEEWRGIRDDCRRQLAELALAEDEERSAAVKRLNAKVILASRRDAVPDTPEV